MKTPNGKIQTEFTDSLKRVGEWLQRYGETIYGTRGGKMMPKEWGVTTIKGKSLFVHILKNPDANKRQSANENPPDTRLTNTAIATQESIRSLLRA